MHEHFPYSLAGGVDHAGRDLDFIGGRASGHDKRSPAIYGRAVVRAHFQTSTAPGGNRRAVSTLRAAAVAVQIALLLARPTTAQPVITDGDIIKLGGTTYRL